MKNHEPVSYYQTTFSRELVRNLRMMRRPFRKSTRSVCLNNVEPKLYEGKAKRVTEYGDGSVEIYFKDDITAFNGEKHAISSGKGIINSQISELLYDYLHGCGIMHHMIDRVDERTLLCHQVSMYPIEVVVRFKAAGSLNKRLGVPLDTVCEPPIIEFYYKRDDLGDPIINLDHVQLLKLATPEEMTTLYTSGLMTATLLRYLFDLAGMNLVDIKFEYGRSAEGLILADEISPDTCRLQDKINGKSLDKDLFRNDSGDLLIGYQEVLRRLEYVLKSESH